MSAPASEAARLAAIRARHAAIAPGRWFLAADGEGMLLEAAGERGELPPVARFQAGATQDEMEFVADAPEAVGFLLALVDRAIAALRARPETSSAPSGRGRAPDYAAEAAMKCAEPAFKKFLIERHGLESPATDERAAQKLRSLLGIGSRAELNDNAAAAERWRGLRRDFDAWRRGGT